MTLPMGPELHFQPTGTAEDQEHQEKKLNDFLRRRTNHNKLLAIFP